jgi:hypothetical protein
VSLWKSLGVAGFYFRKIKLSTFVVLEVFDLAETLGCFLARLVWSSEILSFFRCDFVARFHFFDHELSLLLIIYLHDC